MPTANTKDAIIAASMATMAANKPTAIDKQEITYHRRIGK